MHARQQTQHKWVDDVRFFLMSQFFKKILKEKPDSKQTRWNQIQVWPDPMAFIFH